MSDEMYRRRPGRLVTRPGHGPASMPSAPGTDCLGRSAAVIERVIPDYAESVGKTREYVNAMPGKQPGDPLKAIHAMMDVVESANPPLHLLLGALAYNRFKGKLERWQEEMAAYEAVSLGADYPASAVMRG